ncbi:PID-CTERM protein-sorting domain-containing protein [Lacinutrix chionoecetis]
MIKYKKTFASILFILISFVCSAQEFPPPPQPPTGPVGLPIDGGLIILLVVGAVFGVYKMLRFKKQAF